MKAINLGDNTYSIFSDAMRVYEKLPAQGLSLIETVCSTHPENT